MASSHEEIERFVREHWDEIVSDIAELVSIPSTEDLEAAGPDAPWGPGPRRALDAALGIARRLGLEPHDCEGIIGYADVLGEGTGQIATIAHLDVVPAGPGWDFDPFAVTRRQGYLVGRGVLDDKGPAVLTLWAAHYLLQHHDSLHKRVRVLLGTNEETGMGGARWYVRNFEAPDFLFTPDASWPVVCGEKGSYNTELSWPCDKNGRILEVSGGTVRNAVASAAYAVVRANRNELPSVPRIAVSPLEGGLCRVEATGIGGHAAEPEGTLSAIGVLLNYLLEQGICSDRERTWLEFEHLVYASTDGSAFGIQAKDDLFTPLTIISGTIETRDGRFVQTTDCRYPKSTDPERIAVGMRKTCASYGVELRETHRGNYLYVDPNGPEVQKLLQSYTEWHDGDARPVTLGGGTYAKRFPRAVAFGPEEPRAKDAPAWVGGIHGPNEAIREDSLKKALCTYIRALELLAE